MSGEPLTVVVFYVMEVSDAKRVRIEDNGGKEAQIDISSDVVKECNLREVEADYASAPSKTEDAPGHEESQEPQTKDTSKDTKETQSMLLKFNSSYSSSKYFRDGCGLRGSIIVIYPFFPYSILSCVMFRNWNDEPKIFTQNAAEMGYEYLDHTADIQVHSWGQTLKQSFEQVHIFRFHGIQCALRNHIQISRYTTLHLQSQ